jgi:hypothetical protein
MSWLITPNWYDAGDADAVAYIQAVNAVDTAAGQSGGLEREVRLAIDKFVVGCKADGIWTAIKASCILAGARTLAGALVPLVGTAPTNPFVNPANESLGRLFVSGDYNRKTGLAGDGSTKYLNSNRNNNADPQNNNHNAVWISSLGGNTIAHMGAGATDAGANALITGVTGGIQTRNRATTSFQPGAQLTTGLYAASRSASATFIVRNGSSNNTATAESQSPFNGNLLVFARGTTSSPSLYADSRLAFYSIGESLNLALLDARVTTLINAFAAAIP